MPPRMTPLPAFVPGQGLTYNGQVQELVDVKDIPERHPVLLAGRRSLRPGDSNGTDAEIIVYYRAAGEEAARFLLTVTISKPTSYLPPRPR